MSSGVVVEVIVDAINVRAQPTAAASLAAPGDTGLLKRGDRVYLADGPVTADGFDWYFISGTVPVFWQPFGCETGGPCDFPALGWIATGPADDPWLAVVDVCPPAPPDGFVLHALAPLARLACYSGQTLTISAQVGGWAGQGWLMPLFGAEPAWIGSEASPFVLIGGRAVLPVRYAPVFGECLPGADASTCLLVALDGQEVELDLTIDHPAAASCTPLHTATPLQVAVLRCRAQLVVTAVRTTPAAAG